MARQYGTIFVDIWNDDDFRALPAMAQRMYLCLVTHPSLNLAGVMALTVKKLAGTAADLDKAEVEDNLQVLADAGFIVIDWETEEILVRSFVRWSGIWLMGRPFIGAVTLALQTESLALRRAIAQETYRFDLAKVAEKVMPSLSEQLTRLRTGLTSTNACETRSDAPTVGPSVAPSDAPLNKPLSMGLEMPQPMPPVTATDTGTSFDLSSEMVEFRRQHSEAAQPSQSKKSTKGTRLSVDWALPDDWRSWAIDQGARPRDIDRWAEIFKDHWLSATGWRATKADWRGTWRNWIRRELEDAPKSRGQSSTPPRVRERSPIQ